MEKLVPTGISKIYKFLIENENWSKITTNLQNSLKTVQFKAMLAVGLGKCSFFGNPWGFSSLRRGGGGGEGLIKQREQAPAVN